MSASKDSSKRFSCVFLLEQQLLNDSTFYHLALTEELVVLQRKPSLQQDETVSKRRTSGGTRQREIWNTCTVSHPGNKWWSTLTHGNTTQSCFCLWPHTEATDGLIVISQSGKNIRLLLHINISNTLLSLVSHPFIYYYSIIRLAVKW